MLTYKKFIIPDFYIVGAAKSGTTSLWYYLGQHPEIFMTKDIASKELSYFSPDYGEKYIEQYEKHFLPARKGQKIGEASHSYLTTPESPSLIKTHNPEAKIIIILRNPVHRAFSLYNWMVQHGYEKLSFEEALQREEEILKNKKIIQKKFYHTYYRNYLYKYTGLYYEQIIRYFEYFDRNNIKILLFEDLKENPNQIVDSILSFLGVQQKTFPVDFKRQNTSIKVRNSKYHFFIYNHIPWLCKKLRIPKSFSDTLKSILLNISFVSDSPLKIKDKTEMDLYNFYRDDVIKTSKLINMDLSNWMKDE